MMAIVLATQSGQVEALSEPMDYGFVADPDTLAIAEELGVPIHELATEHQMIDEIGELNASLTDIPGFSQVWISWQPFRVNVSYSHDLSDEGLYLLDAFSRQDLLNHHNADIDRETLESLQLQVVAERDRLGIDAVISLNLFEGLVEIGAPGNDGDALISSAVDRYELDAMARRLAVTENSSSSPTTWGGGTLSNGCSAAFIVTSGSDYGVLSAGHGDCNDPSTYSDPPREFTTSVPYSATANRRDVSIHELSSGTAKNVFRIPFHPGARHVTDTRQWDEMTVGQSVCMNGRTSGWTCGTIANRDISPSYVPGGNRFVETTNTCEPGDSGATWSNGGTAYGIQSGRRSSNHRCWFGAIDYAISGTGWSVKTS